MSARGFTLLEVLIAATLMSIMMVLLFGSLRIGATSWDNGEKRLDRTSQLLVVQSFLRRHLSAAIPWRVGDPVRVDAQFLGTRNSLDYVGFLPAQIKSGLYRFSLFLEVRGGQKSLKLAVRALDASAENEKLEDLELLRDVEDVRFAYLSPMSSEAQPMWVEEWTEDQIPTAVSVRVQLREEEPWPAILVAPRLQSES